MTLYELARETWDGGAESVDEVVAKMRRTISSDKVLFKELLEPIILSALKEFAQKAMRDDRRVALGNYARAPRTELIDGIKQIAARNLLDFRMSGGKRLGDCTGAEVASDAECRQVRIDTELTIVRWQRLIVGALSTPTTVVSTELKHEQLDALLAQAGNGKRVEVAA